MAVCGRGKGEKSSHIFSATDAAALFKYLRVQENALILQNVAPRTHHLRELSNT
jgi:hypothetical protein